MPALTGYTGVISSTPRTIGTGTTNWLVNDVGAYTTGQRVRVIYDELNWMEGTIDTVSTDRIYVQVTHTRGTGSYNSWTFALAGEIGERGFVGSRGPTGASGPRGNKGDRGDRGFTGSRGQVGFTGSLGPSGPSGPAGASGTAGPAGGFTGSVGPTGATGPQGPAGGFTGSAGFTGSQGVIGSVGFTGSKGEDGIIGPRGATGYVGSAGNNGIMGPVGATGPFGPSGPIGPSGIPGAQGPTGGLGYTGSAGPTGPSGPSGPTGGLGYTGSLGPTGLRGESGFAGSVGFTGSIGPAGGPTGPQGTTGFTGSRGDAGFTGSAGTNGTNGNVGFTGSQGVGAVEYVVTNSGASAYIINGQNNPKIVLARGFTYRFTINATGHPFWIKTSPTTGTSDAYTSGVTNNGAANGVVIFTVPLNAPEQLYYICQLHGSMVGQFEIRNIGELGFTGSQGNVGFVGSTGNVGYTGSAGTVTSAADVPLNNVTINGLTTIKQVQEALVVINAATGLVTHDYSQATVFYHTNPAANFTVQLTNYPTTANVAGVVTLVLQQGATGRYGSALTVNGSTVNLRQFNGSVPTVRANKIDVQSITIYNVSGNLNAISQVSTFG